jgi:tRNA G46 methylase TrmB
MKLEAGSLALQAKLAAILTKKAKRAGEFALPFERDSFPLNVRKGFSGFERFALEIGCGWGEFTRALAAQEPGTMHIAIEKKARARYHFGQRPETRGPQQYSLSGA